MDTEIGNPRTAELAHDQRPNPPPQPGGDIDNAGYDTGRVPTPEMAVILSKIKEEHRKTIQNEANLA